MSACSTSFKAKQILSSSKLQSVEGRCNNKKAELDFDEKEETAF